MCCPYHRGSRPRPGLTTASLLVVAALLLASPPGLEGRFFHAAGEPERLAWISAEMATAEDGSIDWAMVPENVRISYHELRTWQPTVIGREADGTPRYDPWDSHAIPGFGAYWGPSHYDRVELAASGSLDELIENAHYVIEGVVSAREPGFFLDEPMTLLTLEVARMAVPEEADRLPPHHRTPRACTLYVAYPSARFSIGGHGFAKGDPAYPPLPEVGDSILFFELTVALDVDRLVFRPEADKLLVSSPGRSIDPEHHRYAWSERRAVPRTLEAVTRAVAEKRTFEICKE